MPKFFEVFGIRASALHDTDLLALKTAICPYTEAQCDGGGNRHQTKITMRPDHELRAVFDTAIGSVIPAVCSIDYGTEQWVVCPRRLMGFRNDRPAVPPKNLALQPHEREALLSAGLAPGIEYGVWSEVYFNYVIDDTEIDYHFDFIIAPVLKNIPAGALAQAYGIPDARGISALIRCARTGKNIETLPDGPVIKTAPCLASPLIIEVMTASTSGSKTSKGTNIAAAFRDLMLGRPYQGPGINKRQVWGRMATQLFAKSALAEAWGGKTYWLVQDQLLRNIALTTRLTVTDDAAARNGTINFIAMKYAHGTNHNRPQMLLDGVARMDAGIPFAGSGACSDILLPKILPPKLHLLKAMLRRNLAAVIEL